jgi:hypothetical protein
VIRFLARLEQNGWRRSRHAHADGELDHFLLVAERAEETIALCAANHAIARAVAANEEGFAGFGLRAVLSVSNLGGGEEANAGLPKDREAHRLLDRLGDVTRDGERDCASLAMRWHGF